MYIVFRLPVFAGAGRPTIVASQLHCRPKLVCVSNSRYRPAQHCMLRSANKILLCQFFGEVRGHSRGSNNGSNSHTVAMAFVEHPVSEIPVGLRQSFVYSWVRCVSVRFYQ